MANVNISDLPVGTALTGAEQVEVIQGGVNKQSTTAAAAAAGAPKAHAASHASAGSDPVSLSGLSGTVATAQIATGAVTPAKVQNVSGPGKLLGRATAGAGSYEEIALGTNLSLSGSTLNAAGGGGGGGSVAVQDEGVTVQATASTVNFTGAGVSAAGGAGGSTTITIPGSGSTTFNQSTLWVGQGTGAGQRSTQARIEDLSHMNVMSFYQGEADHTNAINKAFAAAAAASAGGLIYGWDARTTGVYFPPGDYAYSGGGVVLSGNSGVIIHSIPRTARITMNTNVYLVTVTGACPFIDIHGITLINGKGLFHSTYTTGNVFGRMKFTDITLDGFTECGIGNEAPDFPYWTIRDSMFSPNPSFGATSIALGGYGDMDNITNCLFINHKYGIKIGDRPGGEIHIDLCDFLTFVSGVRQADIWIVPNITDGGTINAGYGSSIMRSKWGNEFQTTTDSRIIVAREDTSNPALTRVNRPHSTVFSTDPNTFFGGLNFKCNHLSSGGGMTAPFIKSYIQNFNRVSWDRSNDIDGQYTYFCQFMGTQSGFTADIFDWNLEFAVGIGGFVPWSIAPTNDIRGDYSMSNNRMACGPNAPTSGFWNAGDVMWRRPAASGQPEGWRCLATGIPGTWTAMANHP